MTTISMPHAGSLALLTDLYQLTMTYGYWKAGRAEDEAVFHLHYRRNPFGGAFSLAAGLESVIEFLERFSFSPDDLAYLETVTGNDGKKIFPAEFLHWLGQMRFTGEVDAIPEGTVVFPHEPLLRIKGPMGQCQLLETPLLNLLNFQTLIATKAARIVLAAQGDPVSDFGLRRAQGPDGALTATRSAYIGGCSSTSNVLAGKLFGIPVRGTHAHSWVMSFSSEQEAFETYAEAMPNNCVLLVDTYDTLEGVRKAIAVGQRLQDAGHELWGVRLDSGDLAALSIEARRMLDEAGLPHVAILASNDLDEYEIAALKAKGARISAWGVGTRLVTAHDQPALGGVYKLAAIRSAPGRPWWWTIKLSENSVKTSIPGIQQVLRFSSEGKFCGDMIFNTEDGDAAPRTMILPDTAQEQSVAFDSGLEAENLLLPVFRAGQRVYDPPALPDIQRRAKEQLARLDAPLLAPKAPASGYPVGLATPLWRLRQRLIQEARGEE